MNNSTSHTKAAEEAADVEPVDSRVTINDIRHEWLMAPIVIRRYGGKSHAGVCHAGFGSLTSARFIKAANHPTFIALPPTRGKE